jgi:hypothetical protein
VGGQGPRALGNPSTSTAYDATGGVWSPHRLRKASAAPPVITGLGGSAGIVAVTGPHPASSSMGS